MDSTSRYWGYKVLKVFLGEFPGGLAVRILGFHCRGLGSIPGRGTEILQAVRPSQKKKKKSFLGKYLEKTQTARG